MLNDKIQNTLFIDSTSLVELRSLLRCYKQLQQIIGPIAEFRVVLDANAAVSDLLHKIKNPHVKQTAIEECIKSGILHVYAPTWLDEEMIHSAIPKASKKWGMPESYLLKMWSEYKKLLRWDGTISLPRQVNDPDLDWKDTPYVDLAENISAIGILSNDKDITRLGGNNLKLDFVLSARDYARATTYFATIYVGGMVLGAASIGAFLQLLRGLITLVLRAPDGIKLVLIAGLIIALMQPQFRERLRVWIDDTGAVMANLWPEIENLLSIAAEKKVEAHKALSSTHSYIANNTQTQA